MAVFGKNESAPSAEAMTYRRDLVENMVFELIPLKSAPDAIAALPPNSTVSVTASPVKGLDATKALTHDVLEAGHRPFHISLLGSSRASNTPESSLRG